jgi:hypothetical protein
MGLGAIDREHDFSLDVPGRSALMRHSRLR